MYWERPQDNDDNEDELRTEAWSIELRIRSWYDSNVCAIPVVSDDISLDSPEAEATHLRS